MSIYDLTFGIEIECFLPAGISHATAAQAINDRLGGTGHCRTETYNHNVPNAWKVTTDGSLMDYARGIEVVSPVLKGEAGFAQMDKVCKALTDLGCTVDRHCGLHVHVGALDQALPFWKKIVRLYQSYEPVIDALMPASRRASANGFCRTLTTTAPANIEAAADMRSLANVIWHATRAREPRYHKVNITPYQRGYKTVEFRQHSGTTDATKTKMWVLTCLRMVEAAMGPTLNFGTTAPTRNTARIGSKAHKIGEMLLRPEGATGPEICAAMGWPSVSVPAQARAAGLEVYSQRTGRVVRYFVRRSSGTENATQLDLTLTGLCALIGSTQEERDYLQQRTANLSGSVPWAA